MSSLPPLIPIEPRSESRNPRERIAPVTEEDDPSDVDGVLLGIAELALSPFFGVPAPPGLGRAVGSTAGVVSSSSLLDIVPVGSELNLEGLETVSVRELQGGQGGGGSEVASALFENPVVTVPTEGNGKSPESSDGGDPAVVQSPTKPKMVPLLGKLKASLSRLDPSGARAGDPCYNHSSESSMLLRVGDTVQFDVEISCVAVGQSVVTSSRDEEESQCHYAVRYCCCPASAEDQQYTVAHTESIPDEDSFQSTIGMELHSTMMLNVRTFSCTGGKKGHVQRVVLEIDSAQTLEWLQSGKLRFQVWETKAVEAPPSIEDILGM